MAVNDVILQNQNISASAPVQQTGAVATASNPVDVTAQSSNDTVSTGNTQGAQNGKKRSVEQLYQSIQALCSSNGIDFNEVKKMGLLSTVSGKNEEYLLNAEDAEIKKLYKLIEETIAAMKEDGIELTAENLEKQARGYQIQLDCGWSSIASFRKANKNSHESVIQRLNRFFGCDFEKLSTEQKAEKLDAYFNRYFNGADSKESIRTKQLTDFSKLLYNSTPEERLVLKDAIEFLCANNRYKGFDSILRSFDTDAERTDFANQVTHEDIQNIGTRPDRAGDVTSEEDMTAITAALMEWKDAEHISEYHTDAQQARSEFFTEENIAKLEEIKTKIENGEELTEEEQALLQEAKFHTSDAAGEIVGVGNNVVVSDDFKTEMLETLNADAYENPNYKEVLEQVNKYIEEHPECLTIPTEEFIKKMNEITNGNFDKVVSGSSEALSAPRAKEETPKTPSTPQLTEADIEASRANITAMTAELYTNNNVELPETIETPATEEISHRSPVKRMIYCIKNIKNNSGNFAKELANTISQVPTVIQTMCLQRTSGEAFSIILDNADDNAIINTDGIGLSTYQSKQLAETIEEIKEEDKVCETLNA